MAKKGIYQDEIDKTEKEITALRETNAKFAAMATKTINDNKIKFIQLTSRLDTLKGLQKTK